MTVSFTPYYTKPSVPVATFAASVSSLKQSINTANKSVSTPNNIHLKSMIDTTLGLLMTKDLSTNSIAKSNGKTFSKYAIFDHVRNNSNFKESYFSHKKTVEEVFQKYIDLGVLRVTNNGKYDEFQFREVKTLRHDGKRIFLSKQVVDYLELYPGDKVYVKTKNGEKYLSSLSGDSEYTIDSYSNTKVALPNGFDPQKSVFLYGSKIFQK